MFTKKKIIMISVVCLIFAIGEYWIFSTIQNTFEKNTLKETKALVKGITSFAPSNDEALSDWIIELSDIYPDNRFFAIKGVPGEEGSELIGGDEALLDLWQLPEYAEAASYATESVSYLEIYKWPKIVHFKGVPYMLMVAPIPDAENSEARATLLAAINSTGYVSFSRLVDALALIAFVLFGVGFGIATFSRDPISGYAIVVLAAIVLAFVAYPLLEAVRLTLIKDGKFSFNVWKTILSNRQYLQALWGSIQLGIVTATISTFIGFVYAFAVARTSMKGKKLVTTLATMPVISPPFSLTLSIILLFGKNGIVTKQWLGLQNINIYGLWGLALAQTISMFPIAFMTMQGVLEAIDSTLEDASLDLNASRWYTFRHVTLPLAAPGLLSSWLLVFTNSLADFANPLLLSGSYRVLSVESYIEAIGMNRLNNGAALSLLLLLPTLTAFLAQRRWVNRKSFVVVTGKPSTRLSDLASSGVRKALTGFVILVSAFIVGLYGTIVAGCFVKNWGIDYSFTLANIGEALTRGKQSLVSTITLAGIATPIAGILAMVAAFILVRKNFPGKRILESLIMAPFAIPGTLIGISFILAFNKPPLLLVGTGAILVINYVVRELPVGVEGGIAALRQIDPSIEEAAADLGADQATIFRTIILPLIRPAFISSMSYTFVRSMTAVSAIIFLISAKWYHITIQIYNFSENLRFGLASVLATTLIIIVLAVFGLMRLLVRQSEYLEKTITTQ
ncbi:MAG TPA: iron ABC transporter permease [Rectinema sp.]|nr:iron ABC transporter permease [Rectinema sp.]HOR48371.1 iron ABC transporter permease [Rectinema sp.]HOU06900.1 iron ABC transporter permease [Rectinema sp.]HOW12266.1 iron ABC transporter permease [Rectinema sp.]HPL71246.1 iron ABC transporter permease [Rectinema sp.]